MLHGVSPEDAKRRLEEIIHKNLPSAQKAVDRALGTIPSDMKAPAECVEWGVNSAREFEMKLDTGSDTMVLPMHGHAMSQAFGFCHVVNGSFAQNCLRVGEDWAKDLLVNAMNEDWQHLLDRDGRQPAHLVRSLAEAPTTGKPLGMAVLSAAYKTFDTRPGLLKILDRTSAGGMVPFKATATDVQFHMSFIDPRVKIVGGDPYALGLAYSNTDFGGTARSISVFLLRLACMNGATYEKIARQVHLGSRLDRDEDWSERTRALDNATNLSALDDAVAKFLLPESQERILASLDKAANQEISKERIERDLKGKLNQTQVKRVVEMVTGADPRIPHTLGVGRFSLMDMVQAVSALSQDVEAKGQSEETAEEKLVRGLNTQGVGDRVIDLERLAGSLLAA